MESTEWTCWCPCGSWRVVAPAPSSTPSLSAHPHPAHHRSWLLLEFYRLRRGVKGGVATLVLDEGRMMEDVFFLAQASNDSASSPFPQVCETNSTDV